MITLLLLKREGATCAGLDASLTDIYTQQMTMSLPFTESANVIKYMIEYMGCHTYVYHTHIIPVLSPHKAYIPHILV